METLIKEVAYFIASIAEGIAVLLIASGILESLWIYGRKTFFITENPIAYTKSRTHLGNSLSLSLEFLIGADILKTAIAPTWQEIGMLAAIVAIRTVLNYFLMMELKSGIIKEKS